MPDEFVPLDTTKYTKFHRELAAKAIIINRNLRYVDNHRKALRKEYPTVDDFRERFDVPQRLIEDIIAEGKKQRIVPKDDDELERTLVLMRPQLKALIARDLWSVSDYYAIMNEYNDVVQRALMLLK